MSVYSDAVLADNPYLYWRLGESSGTVAEDESPNNRDGTYVGSPDLGQPGLVGDGNTSVGFNIGETGQGTEYCQSDVLDWSVVTAFSVEMWVRIPDVILPFVSLAYGPHGIFQDQDNFGINPSPAFQFSYTNTQGLTSDTIVQPDTTYHVVFTLDEDGIAGLYVNCELEDTGTFTIVSFPDGRWTLAATDDTGSSTRYRGIIDEFALYTYGLTESQLALHCNPPPPPPPAEPCQLIEEDNLLLVDASAGDITVSLLESIPLESHIYYIKRVDSTSNVVLVDPYPGVFDGGQTFIELMPWDTIAIISDGANNRWLIL